MQFEQPTVSHTVTNTFSLLQESLRLVSPVTVVEPSEILPFLVGVDRILVLRLCTSKELLQVLLPKCAGHLLSLLVETLNANKGYEFFKIKVWKSFFPSRILEWCNGCMLTSFKSPMKCSTNSCNGGGRGQGFKF